MLKEELFEIRLPYYDNTERLVRVFVPEHERGEKLPVIYMTDGQNLFDFKKGMFGCWYTREAVRAERESGKTGAVIVGIHNDLHPMQRTNELTPKSIGNFYFPSDMPEEFRKMFKPEGELFDDFVVNTVMPAVEREFPVKKGRENVAFCGSSSGGLQSFFTAMSHPDKFCAAGVFSPNFIIYVKEDLESWIDKKVCENMPFLYIYSGGKDELEKEILLGTEAACDMLGKRCGGDKLKKVFVPENMHNEAAWTPVFKDFLGMCFK